MQALRADTETKVRMGPFVDVGDGFTPETGVTLAGGGDNADEAELLKAAGAATVDISGDTWAAIAGCDGWYDLTITAGQLDTEGVLTVVIQNDSVHLPVHKEFMVMNAPAFDSLYAAAGTDYLPVDVTQISDDTTAANNLELFTEILENGTGLIDAGSFKAGAIDAAAIANAAIDNATFAADVGSTAHGTNIIALACRKILEELNLDHLAKVDTTVAGDGDLTAYVVDGSILAHIMAIGADTSDYNASTDSHEALQDRDFNATQKASINTEADTALSDVNLDHLMKTAVANRADMTTEVADDTVLANIMTKTDGDTSDYAISTDSLEALAGGTTSNVALDTTLAVRTSDSVFTLNAGHGTNDAYNNMVLAIQDVTDSHWETRRITDYAGATKTITVDTAFAFVVAANDVIKIFMNAYAPTVAAGGGATAAQVWDYDVSGVTTQGYAGTYQQIAGGRYG